MRLKKCLLLSSLYFLVLSAHAQTKYTRLKIGDKAPDLVFNNIMNYPGGKAKLSDFKGKLIIIDFWNAGCAPCIAAFPRMEKLQQEFGSKIQVLLVNGLNSLKELEYTGFPNNIKSPIIRNTKLPIALNDKSVTSKEAGAEMTPLLRLFPHEVEPFHVWIGPDREVVALTDGEATNSETIQQFLETKKIELPVQRIGYDFGLYHHSDKSILQMENKLVLNNLLYSSVFTRNLHSIKTCGPIIDSTTGKTIGSRVYGSVMTLYTIAGQVFQDSGRQLFQDRFVLEVSHPENLVSPKKESDLLKWEDKNVYYYEVVVPAERMPDAKQVNQSNTIFRKLLKEDIARFTGVSCHFEKRRIKCLILTAIDTTKLSSGEPGHFYEEHENESLTLKNLPFNIFLTRFQIENAKNIQPLPLVNETGFSEYKLVSMNMTADYDDIPALKQQLNSYGLDLTEDEREIEVLVFTDQKAL